ncbi:phage tail assembly chaperone [Wenxinia saemankumensis]|uniref:Phage tail assembly chaperone protein, TAC n=1 Tax=Wenxinia saemankumensis TaxID=1447782 RepID=A0A1M6F076_9RHOB|nr:phage tail assembly chaperone [Wenxinia saemankumensis]SHI91065.1 Phage tail assembly chaperone protein, TAC [Wenxinia saemankumensis]
MTPEEASLWVESWNAAQRAAAGEVEPMSRDRLHELKDQYPDV